MTGFRKLDQLVRVLGRAATVVTLTLAVTLRVEHSCSEDSQPNSKQIPDVFYPYYEFMARSDVPAPGPFRVSARTARESPTSPSPTASRAPNILRRRQPHPAAAHSEL